MKKNNSLYIKTVIKIRLAFKIILVFAVYFTSFLIGVALISENMDSGWLFIIGAHVFLLICLIKTIVNFVKKIIKQVKFIFSAKNIIISLKNGKLTVAIERN